MRFANNEYGEKIEVQFSGQKAVCKCCNSEVMGRFGKIRPKHWYHKSTDDCDSWYEPITKWHVEWQDCFPSENQEIELIDKELHIRHRADIQLNNGLIIEVQNSPIKLEEIEQRENFYSKNGGLIWILNGENLTKKSSIRYKFEKKQHSLSISIPEYINNIDYFNFNLIRDDLIESESIKNLKSTNGFINCEILNGSFLTYYFENKIDFYSAIKEIKENASEVIENLYPKNKIEILCEFDWKFTSIPRDRFVNVKLTKSYWRQFIDIMKSPVFIDKIDGLGKNHLYFYQRNEIVEKDEFLFNVKHKKY